MIREILKSAVFGGGPVHLILHVTNRCNLRCKTCFVNFEKNPKKELTLDEIKEISKTLKDIIWLDISGGEPFIRKDLPEICACFNTKSISIPTNGFNPKLISDSVKKIKKLTKAELSIALSIDGFEKTNDSIRSPGCFKKSLETIALLKEIKGIRVKVNTVLCERNYDEMIPFMKFIKKQDVDFHSVIFLRGDSRDATFRCPSHDKLEKIKPEIFRMWNTYDYGFNGIGKRALKNYQRIMYNTSLRIFTEKRQIPSCLAGKKHLVVYPTGDVAFCEMLPPFGNLKEKKLKNLLHSKKAEAQRILILKKKCYCYHNCNMVDNFFLNPWQYPKLLFEKNK